MASSAQNGAEMKWNRVFITWPVLFFLAPSIWFHTTLVAPPGSPEVSKPLLIPFGSVYFGGELVKQLAGGDLSYAFIMSIVVFIPIIAYTFFLSYVIWAFIRKISRQQLK